MATLGRGRGAGLNDQGSGFIELSELVEQCFDRRPIRQRRADVGEAELAFLVEDVGRGLRQVFTNAQRIDGLQFHIQQ